MFGSHVLPELCVDRIRPPVGRSEAGRDPTGRTVRTGRTAATEHHRQLFEFGALFQDGFDRSTG